LTAESKGTVESLFRWMTERFEKRLPNSSYGVHDSHTAAQAGGMTLEELERCFYQAIVDDYQRDFDTLRQQRRSVLWEQAVAASGVPQYLGSPDDLKLLLMKAVNRKTPHHGYRVQNGNRLSFQGRWYVCPGLLSRLAGREFDVYYDRRDVGVLYIFVEGEYVGEAYCPQLMGAGSVSGKPEPCVNTTRSKRRSRMPKGCQSALAFRTKQELPAVAAVQRFGQVSKHVNGIANARTFIQQKSPST
jgi:hypothetical protein